MKFKQKLTMQVLGRKSLLSAKDMLGVAESFLTANPNAQPSSWGHGEPDEHTFGAGSIRDAVGDAGPLLPGSRISWSRTSSPKLLCSIAARWKSKVPTRMDTHSTITLTGEFGEMDQEFWIENLLRSAADVEADFGVIDAITDVYKMQSQANGAVEYGELYITTHVLRHWIPDVYWGTLFGSAYVEMFGLQNLLDLPVAKSLQVGPKTVYIQLTDNIQDIVDRPELTFSCRERVKKSLLSNSFFDPGQYYDFRKAGAVGTVFTTPKFLLSNDEV